MVASADFESVVIMELTQIKKENDSVVAPADFESVVALVLTTMVSPADFESVVTMVLAQVKKENDAVVAPVDFESVVALIGTRRGMPIPKPNEGRNQFIQGVIEKIFFCFGRVTVKTGFVYSSAWTLLGADQTVLTPLYA
ncbi:hypothetical protein F4703DRAFT_1947976 [Phycomyces blakesleeanus]